MRCPKYHYQADSARNVDDHSPKSCRNGAGALLAQVVEAEVADLLGKAYRLNHGRHQRWSAAITPRERGDKVAVRQLVCRSRGGATDADAWLPTTVRSSVRHDYKPSGGRHGP